MSKAVAFILGAACGAAAGAVGLCWFISKYTAGITWYTKGEMVGYDK